MSREDLCEKDILHKIMNEWSVFSGRYGIIKLRERIVIACHVIFREIKL